MFKVNNKDTRTYFTHCSSVSIVNFEQVNANRASCHTLVKIERSSLDSMNVFIGILAVITDLALRERLSSEPSFYPCAFVLE